MITTKVRGRPPLAVQWYRTWLIEY